MGTQCLDKRDTPEYWVSTVSIGGNPHPLVHRWIKESGSCIYSCYREWTGQWPWWLVSSKMPSAQMHIHWKWDARGPSIMFVWLPWLNVTSWLIQCMWDIAVQIIETLSSAERVLYWLREMFGRNAGNGQLILVSYTASSRACQD